MFLDDLGEQPAFHSEQAFLLAIGRTGFAGNKQRQAHPEGHSDYNFKQDAPKRENIHYPWIIVLGHDLLIEVLLILAFILVDDVVEYFRRHVLRGGHRELGNILELETGPIVDQFGFTQLEAVRFLLMLVLYQDVLGFEIRVYDFA